MFNPIIDNMPKKAIPLYDCDVDAKVFIFKNGKLRIIKKAKEFKTRILTPLIKISSKSLMEIGQAIKELEKLDVWDRACCLCIKEDKIGLICVDSRKKGK